MTKFGHLIMGPAGSGKTTYCKALCEYNRLTRTDKRNIRLVNLDPGAEDSPSADSKDTNTSRNTPPDLVYDIDIRELISIDDVMEEFADGDEEDEQDGDLSETEELEVKKEAEINKGDNQENGSKKLGKKVKFDLPPPPPSSLIQLNSLFKPNNTVAQQQANEHDNATDLSTVHNPKTIGPNGALIYCMEYLARDNFAWLKEKIEEAFIEGDYVLFDCPGQIELFMHHWAIRRLVNFLTDFCDFRICGVFMVDAAHFLVDVHKYFSVALTSLAVMVNLEQIPFVNVFSKMDLVDRKLNMFSKVISATNHLPSNKKSFVDGENDLDDRESADDPDDFAVTETNIDEQFLADEDLFGHLSEPSIELHEYLTSDLPSIDSLDSHSREGRVVPSLPRVKLPPKFSRLTQTLASVLDSYNLVKFHPLNLNDKHSIASLLYQIDLSLQYDDEREPPERMYTGAEREIDPAALFENLEGDNRTDDCQMWGDDQHGSSEIPKNGSGENNEMFYGID